MEDLFLNGDEWRRMQLLMIGFYHMSCEGVAATGWQPLRRPGATEEEALQEWRAIEALHTEAVSTTARELAKTSRVQCPSPEVAYYLHRRVCLALEFVERAFAWRGEQPISIIPFPSVAPRELAEWFLTEWADGHCVIHSLQPSSIPRHLDFQAPE